MAPRRARWHRFRDRFDGERFCEVRAARNVSYLLLRALSGTEGGFGGENVAGVSLHRGRRRVLGASWRVLRASWRVLDFLEASWAVLEASWAPTPPPPQDKPVASMGTGSALRNNESMNTFQIAFPSYTSKMSATKKASCAAARLTCAMPSKRIFGTSRKLLGDLQSANSTTKGPTVELTTIKKTTRIHPKSHPKNRRCAQDAPSRPKMPPKTTPRGLKTPPTRPKTTAQNRI